MGGGSGGSQSPSWKSNGGSRSISRSVQGKRSHSSTIDGGRKGSTMRKDQSENSLLQSEHPNGTVTSSPPDDRRRHHQQGKSNGEEWPGIHIGLSRKEKEEDFLAIKATKLPHRPKKRSKAVDRNLQYCFPGTFLSDLSRSRYEVRERKSVRKLIRRCCFFFWLCGFISAKWVGDSIPLMMIIVLITCHLFHKVAISIYI